MRWLAGCAALYHLISFNRFLDNRLLHSFPTRRSSDLRAHREQEAYMQSLSNESAPLLWAQIAPLLEDAMGKLREKERNAVDRKSTRLNSSHPSISYAVFCLKKKKHYQSHFATIISIND